MRTDVVTTQPLAITDGVGGALTDASVVIFCKVIDNLGDVGVAWRLARQLRDEARTNVVFVVDCLDPFAIIEPSVSRSSESQAFDAIDVIRWDAFAESRCLRIASESHLVIEAFGAEPPAWFHAQVAARTEKPVWINLEYLTAEPWIESVHGLPSPHPKLPLLRHFFCPGFTETSGGLIRERSIAPIAELAPSHVDTESASASLRVFAFTYPGAPLAALTEGFRAAGRTAEVFTPFPPGSAAHSALEPTQANRATHRIETVPQTQFDALLSTFDLLIVRGEDSFVRAQFAGKPMLWHIYPTGDAAHLVKLDAWLDRYCTGLGADAASAMRCANHALVENSDNAGACDAFMCFARALPTLADHAVVWQRMLLAQSDLLTRLQAFFSGKPAARERD